MNLLDKYFKKINKDLYNCTQTNIDIIELYGII